jgi:hypothetical protein
MRMRSFMRNRFPLTIALILFLQIIAHAQAPLQFNYQAVARDNRGAPMAMKDIRIRFTIVTDSPEGSAEYSETRKIQTNQFGMFTVSVGSEGAITSTGSLKDVKWEKGKKFLRAEIDPRGSNNFIDLGATQLVSVPYAMFALRTMNETSGGFSGVAGNGVSIKDSVVMLGNKEGEEGAALQDNRVIPLNGNKLSFQDGAATIDIAKSLINIQQDSSLIEGDTEISGGSFLRVNPLFPRADAVPFVFTRAATRQHGGAVSPNEVVMWGHNLSLGGGPLLSGLPGIGYSVESNFKPTPSDRWVESHEFYITPLGRQIRLKSYTVDTKTDYVDFYHSIDNIYFKNPRTGTAYFRIDNFGDKNEVQQLDLGNWRLHTDNSSKQVQMQAKEAESELFVNVNWKTIYFPGMMLSNNGPQIMKADFIPENDNTVSLGNISNRFANIKALNFSGERISLKSNWAAYEDNSATSNLDILGQDGFNQLRLRKTYTPTGSGDPNGNVGDVAWDKDYLYIKTAEGWKRTGLSSF